MQAPLLLLHMDLVLRPDCVTAACIALWLSQACSWCFSGSGGCSGSGCCYAMLLARLLDLLC